MEPSSHNPSPLDVMIQELEQTGRDLQEKVNRGIPGAEKAFEHFKALLIAMAKLGVKSQPFAPSAPPRPLWKLQYVTMCNGASRFRPEWELGSGPIEEIRHRLAVIEEKHQAAGIKGEWKSEVTSIGETIHFVAYEFPPNLYWYENEPVDALAVILSEASPEPMYRLEFDFEEHGETGYRPELDFGPAPLARINHRLAGIESRHAESAMSIESTYEQLDGNSFATVIAYHKPDEVMRIAVIETPPTVDAALENGK